MQQVKLFFLVTCLSVFLLSSCGEDEPEIQTYKIKVTNITSNDADVYISSNGGNSFESKGSIPAGEFREYTLALNVSYTMRASWKGNSVDQYFDQQLISNDNPDIISLNVDISE